MSSTEPLYSFWADNWGWGVAEEQTVPKTELLRATEHTVFLAQLLPDSLTSLSQPKQFGVGEERER